MKHFCHLSLSFPLLHLLCRSSVCSSHNRFSCHSCLVDESARRKCACSSVQGSSCTRVRGKTHSLSPFLSASRRAHLFFFKSVLPSCIQMIRVTEPIRKCIEWTMVFPCALMACVISLQQHHRYFIASLLRVASTLILWVRDISQASNITLPGINYSLVRISSISKESVITDHLFLVFVLLLLSPIAQWLDDCQQMHLPIQWWCLNLSTVHSTRSNCLFFSLFFLLLLFCYPLSLYALRACKAPRNYLSCPLFLFLVNRNYKRSWRKVKSATGKGSLSHWSL